MAAYWKYCLVLTAASLIVFLLWQSRSRSLGSMSGIRLPFPAWNSSEVPAEPALFVSCKDSCSVRLLCWVMTSPASLRTKAAFVNSTWLQRCDVKLFMSSEKDPQDPSVIDVVTSEGRDQLTRKTMNAFKYIYDHHYNDANWFLKADDDTYVVVENLKRLLRSHNPNDPVYFGHHFQPHVKPQGYNSGGAGYVLSKRALFRFGMFGYGQEHICHMDGPDEDVELGRCMQNVGVRVGDSYDEKGRSRFHGYHPTTHLSGNMIKGYAYYDFNNGTAGMDTVSEYVITFHYVKPYEMLLLEYLMYHFKKSSSHELDGQQKEQS